MKDVSQRVEIENCANGWMVKISDQSAGAVFNISEPIRFMSFIATACGIQNAIDEAKADYPIIVRENKTGNPRP